MTFKMVLVKKNLKKISEIGVLVAILISIGISFTVATKLPHEPDFWRLLVENLLTVFAVGIAAAICGRFVYFRNQQRDPDRVIRKTLGATMLGALIGRGIGIILHILIQGRKIELWEPVLVETLPSLVMSQILSLTAVFYWRRQSPAGFTPINTVTRVGIRCRGQITYVRLSDILYVTAHGKKTIVHTMQGDIECSMMLKRLIDNADIPGLRRVHKSYALIPERIAALRRNGPREHLAIIGDEDFLVPVTSGYLNDLLIFLK